MSFQAEEITFGYRSGQEILSNICFQIDDGKVLSILGPNGTGKTTLLKCISSILKPVRGRAVVNGREVAAMGLRERAKCIGYVPQYENSVFPINVIDTIMMGRLPYSNRRYTEKDREIVFHLLSKMELEDYAFRFTNELSGGERQRIFIARALAQEPQFLLLDEPTASLDLKNQIFTLDLIQSIAKQKGLGVIMSIHDLNLAAMFSDKILMLKDSKVFAFGTVEEVITEENIKAVYGVSTEVTIKDCYQHVRLRKNK